MKKIFFVFIFVYAYSDVSFIINKIKKLEQYKPKFKKIQNYSVFSNEILDLNKTQKITQKITQIKESKTLTLNAIFQNKANINGVWVKRRDFIEGFKILKIKRDSVVLKKDNKIIVLSLKPKLLKVAK